MWRDSDTGTSRVRLAPWSGVSPGLPASPAEGGGIGYDQVERGVTCGTCRELVTGRFACTALPRGAACPPCLSAEMLSLHVVTHARGSASPLQTYAPEPRVHMLPSVLPPVSPPLFPLQGVWVRHHLVPHLRSLPGLAQQLEEGCMVGGWVGAGRVHRARQASVKHPLARHSCALLHARTPSSPSIQPPCPLPPCPPSRWRMWGAAAARPPWPWPQPSPPAPCMDTTLPSKRSGALVLPRLQVRARDAAAIFSALHSLWQCPPSLTPLRHALLCTRPTASRVARPSVAASPTASFAAAAWRSAAGSEGCTRCGATGGRVGGFSLGKWVGGEVSQLFSRQRVKVCPPPTTLHRPTECRGERSPRQAGAAFPACAPVRPPDRPSSLPRTPVGSWL